MHLRVALLVSVLAISGSAYRVDGSEYGFESDLVINPLVNGARVTNDLYNNCTEKNEVGEQVSYGEDCIGRALQYMIEALSDAHNANQMVALLSNTVNGVQSIAPSPANSTATAMGSSSDSALSTAKPMANKFRRRDGDTMHAALIQLNDQIRRRSEGGRRPSAVHIGHSEIHPTDGLAIRTNVQSGDATLHVHTNGSHATAAFQMDAFVSLKSRYAPLEPASRFYFKGAQGLKLQIISREQQAYGVLNVLLAKGVHGGGEVAPKLKDSDSWALTLCRRSDKGNMLLGKLIAEDDGAGYEWEDGMVGCTAE